MLEPELPGTTARFVPPPAIGAPVGAPKDPAPVQKAVSTRAEYDRLYRSPSNVSVHPVPIQFQTREERARGRTAEGQAPRPVGKLAG